MQTRLQQTICFYEHLAYYVSSDRKHYDVENTKHPIGLLYLSMQYANNYVLISFWNLRPSNWSTKSMVNHVYCLW